MSMFWGLSMKPNRKYTQTIVKSFHISGVALDEGESAKLYITADKTKFIVATLSKSVPQMALDLNFCKGDKIMFQTTGDALVSLIGYLHDAEESDDEFEDAEYENVVNALKQEKGIGGNDSDSDNDGSEEAEEEDDDEDEDVDDSKLAAEYSSFLEDESGEEEDDEDEEEDDSEDEEEEEDAPKAKKAKVNEAAKKSPKEQNGVAKKEGKQQQQQQQQQQKSKKDKKAATAAPEAKKEQPKAKDAKQAAGERTIVGGVKVQDLQNGNGPEAKQGKRVSVYYIGRLKSNNKTFDSMQKGNGFKFALGAGEVIKGWDVGVVGMKVGGKRRITCPAHMAYGTRGHPPTIPPNSTLVFDVELKAVH
ncbi:39 kDa FK506-binding nuclear protein [Drosophila novamexicana]|uniref:39 kDa FK506-binding nuclear protein n=1 Tax=Drosophila novamexicana TaxID=47314 RepID=UPI0011E5C3C5|nr:39 kDa FK506-binding nuclear protein [Drosophila novamexicana]